MGILSTLFGGGHDDDGHHDWPEEFDRRLAKGDNVDYGMTGRPRVKDANGNYFTRDGKDCCGCGKSRNMGAYDPDEHTYKGGYHGHPLF